MPTASLEKPLIHTPGTRISVKTLGADVPFLAHQICEALNKPEEWKAVGEGSNLKQVVLKDGYAASLLEEDGRFSVSLLKQEAFSAEYSLVRVIRENDGSKKLFDNPLNIAEALANAIIEDKAESNKRFR